MSRQFVCLAIFGLVCFGSSLTATDSASVIAQTQAEQDVIVTATAGKIGADGQQTVTVKLQIKRDWYVLANRVEKEVK